MSLCAGGGGYHGRLGRSAVGGVVIDEGFGRFGPERRRGRSASGSGELERRRRRWLDGGDGYASRRGSGVRRTPSKSMSADDARGRKSWWMRSLKGTNNTRERSGVDRLAM